VPKVCQKLRVPLLLVLALPLLLYRLRVAVLRRLWVQQAGMWQDPAGHCEHLLDQHTRLRGGNSSSVHNVRVCAALSRLPAVWQ
jgi:hypothetical protein